MNKEIIEKIQKLLSLATSDNKNEAEMASKKAQELLIKYNLSMCQVEIKEYEHETIDANRDPSNKFINNILTDFFFVYIYKSGKFFVVNGTTENIKIAMYVRSFLLNSFKQLYKNEAKLQGWTNGSNRNAFYYGLFIGLKTQLKENQRVHDIGNGLMVINQKLVDFVKSKNDIKTKNSNVKAENRDAVNSGIEHGKNLKISKGLEKSENNTKVFLK